MPVAAREKIRASEMSFIVFKIRTGRGASSCSLPAHLFYIFQVSARALSPIVAREAVILKHD